MKPLLARALAAGQLARELPPPEAEREFRRLLAIDERVLGPEDPETLRCCYNLAVRLGMQKKYQKAMTCAQRSYTLRFDHTGKAILKVDESCAGRPSSKSFTGRYDFSDNIAVTVDAPGWPKNAALTLASCPRLDAPGSCFTLTDGERSIGPFHRGVPGLSPLSDQVQGRR